MSAALLATEKLFFPFVSRKVLQKNFIKLWILDQSENFFFDYLSQTCSKSVLVSVLAAMLKITGSHVFQFLT